MHIAKSLLQPAFLDETSDKKTKSHIKLLKQDERVVEIAKMLSGKSLTDASIKSAKELLTK